jgi:glucokinase
VYLAVLFGIDIGGTNTKVGLVDQTGILALASIPTLVPQGPEKWLGRLGACVDQLVAGAGLSRGEIKGAGLDCPGSQDLKAGKVIFAANLPTFNGYALRDSVSKMLGVPTVMDNDANTYAYGEYFFGVGKARHDLVCITLGTGVGGGIVLNGQVLSGPLGVGGELGHIVIEPHGRKCTCGSIGCVECYASATGFRGMLAEALDEGRETRLIRGDDVKEMAEAAENGDPLALEMFGKAGVALARGVTNIVVTTGIGLIVIGAGISRSFESLMRGSFDKELAIRLHMADPASLNVVTSTLGNQAAVMGAAAWAARCLDLNWRLAIAK